MAGRYRLIFHQRWGDVGGMEILNVFHYHCGNPTSSAQHLVEVFMTVVVDAMAALQSTAVDFESIESFNIDDPTDFYATNILTPTGGEVTGDALPPFTCWEFKLLRASRASRHGWKRIAGVSEGSQIGGLPVPDVGAQINTVTNALMSAMLAPGTEEWYVPQICRRPPVGQPITASVFFPISGAMFSRISTQNTRKLGRGS